MFKTRITELFGIKYPIIQGGMMWISRAKLVVAVSNAGGLGIIAAFTFPTPQELADEIKKTRGLTDKPFGVNITLLPTLRPVDIDGYFNAVIDTGIKIVETAGRSPEPYMERLKAAGIKVIHKCTAVRFARTAQRIGCEAVSIDGFECAGPVVFEEHIAFGDQRIDDVARLLLFQVQDQAALVAVQRREARALRIDHGRHGPRLIAPRRTLDLDDVRSHIAQEHAAKRAGNVAAELQYSDTFKWLRHRFPPCGF